MQQEHDENSAPTTEKTRPASHLQRLLQPSGEIDSARSAGEALVPFLLALAEACWFNGLLIGLAGVDFLHTGTALLPFWGPPLLFCVALWLFQRALYQEAKPQNAGSPESEEKTQRLPAGFSLMFGIQALLALGLTWLHIYSGTYFLLDPRWLLALLNDLLALNAHFAQILTIAIIAAYFCWRASRVAQTTLEPGHARRLLWIGLLVLLGAILLRAVKRQAGGNLDDIVLVLLIPAFLYFVLSAHALAHTSFVRRSHPFGLDGNIANQERAMLSIIGGVGLSLLLLTLVSGLAFSATFWTSLQPVGSFIANAYGWLVDKISMVLGWVLQPVFALIFWLASLLPHNQKPPSLNNTSGKIQPKPPAVAEPGIIVATEVLLPILLLLGLVLLIWLVTRRRKRVRLARNRASGDVHESVWSWKLFWSQLKAFFAALLGRKKAGQAETEADLGIDGWPAEPAARTIREIYRALLKKAASTGFVRRRNETPHEFQKRLDQLHPVNSEPQLGQLTEAYALTRYGGAAPGDFELTSLRHSWDELSHKWDAPAP